MAIAQLTQQQPQWKTTYDLCDGFARRAAEHDRDGSFVTVNYDELRRAQAFSAAISSKLGGGGATFPELCELLQTVAKACPSTALSLAMHTHLVAASVYKLKRGALGEEALQRKIVDSQMVLVSTGASDWVDSNGHLTPVDGGYLYSGRKVFASASPAASVMVTTGRLESADGAEVLHFPVPFNSEGVSIQDDWDALGMRGTGSHSVVLQDVFIAEEKIALRRPAGQWHPAWNVVLGVAMPLIVAVYRGIAERARDLALETWAERTPPVHLLPIIGEMENQLTATQLAADSMIELNDNYRFEASLEHSNAVLQRKTLAAQAAEDTVRLACSVAGGRSFFRSEHCVGLEQLRRDIQAVHFHPLPQSKQWLFSARCAVGLDPVAG